MTASAERETDARALRFWTAPWQSSKAPKGPEAFVLSHFCRREGSPPLPGWLTEWLENRLQMISCW
jgi:hypothetical protein